MTDQCDHAGCTGDDRDPGPPAPSVNHRPWLGMRAEAAVAAEDAARARADALWRPAAPIRSHGTVYRRGDPRLRRSKRLLAVGLVLMFVALLIGAIGGIIAGVQIVWWAP